MNRNQFISISHTDIDEKVGEFWDTHDFTGFDTDAPDVEFEVVCTVPIEAHLLNEIEQQASQQGVKVEALINLWLRQKLAEQTVA